MVNLICLVKSLFSVKIQLNANDLQSLSEGALVVILVILMLPSNDLVETIVLWGQHG